MLIDLHRFVSAERPTWEELESMLARMESQPGRRLALEEAQRFHFLYQKVSADLARITTFASEPQLRRYLESLVARAYVEIHETRAGRERGGGIRWFFEEFPAVFRRRFAAFALSLAMTLAGVALGGFAVALDDEAKEAIVPAQFSHLMGDPAERVRREEEAKRGSHGGHATFAGSLMTNNIGVSIKAMAFGLLWGIGTLLLLFYNGVILGLVAIDYILAGQTVFLLGWLMPHGVIEIPAILIAGQAGLVLGNAVLGRGDRAPLAERLRAVRRDVVMLIGGVAVLLVWAGIVESFLSQYHEPLIPYWVKIAFGAAELVLLVWFLSPKPRAAAAGGNTSAR
jgi:uncharacterized membrane protein SpoIIM required for sporulation